MKRFFENVSTAFGALLALILAGWVTDGLNGTPILFLSSFLPGYDILKAVVLGLFLLACSTWALYRYKRPKIGQVLEPQLVDNPREVVIAMLSSWTEKKDADNPADRGFSLPEPEDLTGLNQDQIMALFADKKFENWNGLPLLHGLLAHQQKLKCCYLLVTEGAGGSSERFAYMRDLLNLLLPEVEVNSTPIKAADVNNLYKYYEKFQKLEAQIKLKGFQERDVMIDSTGGPKLFSMAAAYATLHNDYALQYVKLEGGKPGVLEFSYEVKAQKSEH